MWCRCFALLLLLIHYRPGALLLCRSDAIRNVVESVSKEIVTLSGLSMLERTQDVNGAPVGCGVAVINDQLTVYLKLQSVAHPAKEVEKFENRRVGLQLIGKRRHWRSR